MDKSSSLGMPMSPQEIFNRYKRQSLGMPRSIPIFIIKVSGHFSMRYIFIASCNMCYSWSVFIFCCVFYFSIKLDPIILYFGVRHAPPVLHIYFGVRHAPLFLHFALERDTLHLFSSLIFLIYYL